MRAYILVPLLLVLVGAEIVYSRKGGTGAAKKVDQREQEAKVISVWCDVTPKSQAKLKKCEKKMPEKAKQLEAEARTAVASSLSDPDYRSALCDPQSQVHKEILDFKMRKWDELRDQENVLTKKEKKKLKKYYKCVTKGLPPRSGYH